MAATAQNDDGNKFAREEGFRTTRQKKEEQFTKKLVA